MTNATTNATTTDGAPPPRPSRRPSMRRPVPPEMIERGARPFDPPAGLRALHAQGPVAPVTLTNGARAWVVTGYEEARAVFSDTRFSSDRIRRRDALSLSAEEVREGLPDAGPPAPDTAPAAAADGAGAGPGHGIFLFMDPPEHTRLRSLLVGQFTVRRMRALTEQVTAYAVDLVETMRAGGTSAELVSAFALPLPSLVICDLLGVDHAERPVFQERAAVTLDLHRPESERDAAAAQMHAFMARLVADKRARPTDDLLSGLIHDTDADLSDAELVDIAQVLLTAGHETTANMLALGTFALLSHPEALAALREDPSSIDTAVEELLRYLSILHLGLSRVATADLEVGGVTVRAGETVLLSVPEANRDAGHWPDPDRLDVTRPRRPHLAFGHGVHQCLGQQLARVEMRVGFTELLARLPDLRLDTTSGEVPLRTDMLVYGVHALPVAWG